MDREAKGSVMAARTGFCGQLQGESKTEARFECGTGGGPAARRKSLGPNCPIGA